MYKVAITKNYKKNKNNLIRERMTKIKKRFNKTLD